MKVLEGKLTAKGMKVAIVASRFNDRNGKFNA